MGDMTAVIVPKSDQISADDFIAGPKTYTIEAVDVRPGTEQPVNIHLVGEDRAWRPCKSMSRVLVAAWGPDSAKYRGKSLTLYRDPKVKWGGMEIGGIRVSHLSDIDREMLLQLTATKGKRAPHIVKPLVAQKEPTRAAQPEQPQRQARQTPGEWAESYIEDLRNAAGEAETTTIRQKGAKALAKLKSEHPDIYANVIEVDPASAIPDQPATGSEPAGAHQADASGGASAQTGDA